MNITKRIASIAVVAVLSVAGLAAVTMAAEHEGRWGDSARAEPGGKHGGKSMCRRGNGGKHDKHGWRHRGPDYLAKRLSVMETRIGIRADQLDTWRDFTDALQATMKRPMRPGGPGMMTLGGNAEAFSLAESFADKAIDRAKSAEDLKKAIAELRTTLTPEQLEKVKEIEARMRAKMARHHGVKVRAVPTDGKGPHAPPPQAAPDRGQSDAPYGDDGKDADE